MPDETPPEESHDFSRVEDVKTLKQLNELSEIGDRYDGGLLIKSPPPEEIEHPRELEHWIRIFESAHSPTRRISIDDGRQIFEFSLYDVSQTRHEASVEHIDEIHEEGYGNKSKDDIIGPYVGMDRSGCLIDHRGSEPRITKFVLSMKEDDNPPVGSMFSGVSVSALRRLSRLEEVIHECNAPEEVTALQQFEDIIYPDMKGKAFITSFDTDLDPSLFFEFVFEVLDKYQEEFDVVV